MSNEYECPHCLADLRGDEISTKYQSFYKAKKYHTKRIIIKKDDKQYAYFCPECKVIWHCYTGAILPDTVPSMLLGEGLCHEG